MDHYNTLIRAVASSVLRHTPMIRGRNRVADLINRSLPLSETDAMVLACMRLHYCMSVDLRSRTEYLSYYTGDYDTSEIQIVTALIETNWTIADVGANIGFWTVPLAQAVPNGRVYSFEPLQSNYNRLCKNIELNRVTKIVSARKIGLSDKHSTLALSLREDFASGAKTGNAAIVIDDSDRAFPCLSIDVAPMDDYISSPHNNRLDFMKVDIEGHEDLFLKGASKTIENYRPIIFLEVNEPYYKRRGIDATTVFSEWLLHMCYKSVVRVGAKWSVQNIARRRPVIDNVFLIPAEKETSLMRKLDAHI